MIYECTGGHTVDDDKDVGTLIGENWYCEGCLSRRNGVIKECVDVVLAEYKYRYPNSPVSTLTKQTISAIEQLKGT